MMDLKKWWTNLEELERGPVASPEFPDPPDPEEASPDDANGVGRRDFLRVMGFGAAATTAACSRSPVRQGLPFARAPEDVTPGAARYYASACGACAAGCGLLIKVRDGRPIKVEGLAEHPVSGSAVCALGQAAPMSLYDSNRPRQPTIDGRTVAWADLDAAVSRAIEAARTGNKQVVLVTGALPGPTTRLLVKRFATTTGARHVTVDPLSPSAIALAHAASHGRRAVPAYRFDRADLVVSFGADFLGTWLAPAVFAHQWGPGRHPDRVRAKLSRHVQFEARMSLTGSNADERIRLAPSETYPTLAALAVRVLANAEVAGKDALLAALRAAPPSPLGPERLDGLAAELTRARGKSLVVSDSTEPRAQLAVNAINAALGNYGATVDLAAAPAVEPQDEDVAGLVRAMEAGQVGVVVVWGTNPVYHGPHGAAFRAALARVPTRVAIADRRDETAAECNVVAPDTHFLETWGDTEARAGVLGLQQPAMRSLYQRRPGQECFLRWTGERALWSQWLRRTWERSVFSSNNDGPSAQARWDRAVERGFVEAAVTAWTTPDGAVTIAPEAVRPFDGSAVADAITRATPPDAGDGDFELVAHASVAVRAGRDANNPWLQELSDPIAKVAWGNFVSVAHATARRLGIATGDVLAVSAGEVTVEAPALVQPGQHDAVLALAMGYGRTVAGPVADRVGANVHPLLNDDGGRLALSGRKVRVRRTGRTEPLAITQREGSAHGRDIVREAPFSAFLRDPRAGNPEKHHALTLWSGHAYTGHKWAMAIDLSKCTGCSACVVACQVENNVPVVGKAEVTRNREMSWLRIDRYYAGDPSEPDVIHQPMLCQHCDNAPCETVCPVVATVHSAEGLNQQVYNRCVGTRYCANNCPYKVRRFNWFTYPHTDPEARLALNPDVAVRTRGVMEKCSFCVQRIQEAKWDARIAGRPLADGDVKPACQQSCPSQAIVFGDVNDHESAVAHAAHDPRGYRALDELGVRPSVTYLTKIRNRGGA